ncbi:Hypothetical protein FKW44_014816 [Caligus rogercresseyi]|uniref:Uncharacterized protein n=1 Tax=Caligus rogercresseyi TaxID=217165 RepID=A0A7T8GZI6_CALRO|nr:Hypothetical protein FKW44_014816 [Caligus rogercresseyi]
MDPRFRRHTRGVAGYKPTANGPSVPRHRGGFWGYKPTGPWTLGFPPSTRGVFWGYN